MGRMFWAGGGLGASLRKAVSAARVGSGAQEGQLPAGWDLPILRGGVKTPNVTKHRKIT